MRRTGSAATRVVRVARIVCVVQVARVARVVCVVHVQDERGLVKIVQVLAHFDGHLSVLQCVAVCGRVWKCVAV